MLLVVVQGSCYCFFFLTRQQSSSKLTRKKYSVPPPIKLVEPLGCRASAKKAFGSDQPPPILRHEKRPSHFQLSVAIKLIPASHQPGSLPQEFLIYTLWSARYLGAHLRYPLIFARAEDQAYKTVLIAD